MQLILNKIEQIHKQVLIAQLIKWNPQDLKVRGSIPGVVRLFLLIYFSFL